MNQNEVLGKVKEEIKRRESYKEKLGSAFMLISEVMGDENTPDDVKKKCAHVILDFAYGKE